MAAILSVAILITIIVCVSIVLSSYNLNENQWECTKSELTGPLHYQEDECIQYNRKAKP